MAPPTRVLDPAVLDDVADLLQGASRPLILAGRGVWASSSAEAYLQLATRLGAALATTAAARGLFGQDGPVCGGFAPEETATHLRTADVVLAVGTSLTPFTMRFGETFTPGATLVHVNLDPTQFHPRAALTVEADAAGFAAALLERLPAGTRTLVPSIPPAAGPPPALPAAERGGRAHPEVIARALDDALPRERTVVSDGGHFIGWPAVHWAVPDPSAFLQVGTAYKCIGLGTGGAVGAAVARPDRTTVLVTGDGGLQMSLPDLVTLAGLPGRRIVVVFNDAAYGAELHQFGPREMSLRMARLGDTQFAPLGDALGGDGITVWSEADVEKVAAWVGSHEDGFLMVDCKIDPQVVAPFFREIVERGQAARTGGLR